MFEKKKIKTIYKIQILTNRLNNRNGEYPMWSMLRY